MNASIGYDDEKEKTNNGSKITGVLKHKIEKTVKNEKSTGVSFTKTKKTINGRSKLSKYFRSVLGSVTNNPAVIQQDWGYFRS